MLTPPFLYQVCHRRRWIMRLLLALLVASIASIAGAWTRLWAAEPDQSLADIIAPYGCAMAHCDQALRDLAIVYGPYTTTVTVLWHDTSVFGSDKGLGCSSNGTTAVCSMTTGDPPNTPTLVAYDATGNHLWSSSLLNATAFMSAPLIGTTGQVIAADDSKLVRFDAAGNILWATDTPGGTPLSPNVTNDRMIFLGAHLGPLSAYDADSGLLLAQLELAETLTINGQPVSGTFYTTSTPAVRGNRAYVATQFYPLGSQTGLPYGRLYAVDIARTSATSAELQVAWYYEFRAPSSASPLLFSNEQVTIVYLDGQGLIPGGNVEPHFLAVQDLGAESRLLWKYPMPNRVVASAAQDPRGGIWVYSVGVPVLIRLTQFTGMPVQTINLDALVQEPGTHIPSSALTITGTDPKKPLLILSATAVDGPSSYVTAIYLPTGGLLWKHLVDQTPELGGIPHGQFPIVVSAAGKPIVVFPTKSNGNWALTMP